MMMIKEGYLFGLWQANFEDPFSSSTVYLCGCGGREKHGFHHPKQFQGFGSVVIQGYGLA